MRRILFLALVILLCGCTGGSKIDNGFLGGVAMSNSQSLVSADSTTVQPGDSMTVRLQIRDSNGNPFYVPGSAPTVSFSTSGGTSTGTFSAVTDSQNGTFSATFTGTGSGSTTHIRATYNGTLIGSYASVTVAVLNGFTLNIPFTAGSDSDYVIGDSTRMELSGGVAKLTAASQTDDDNSSTQWGDATVAKTGVSWDATNSYIRLNTTINNSDLDSSWAPEWSSLAGYWKMNNDWTDALGTHNGTVHSTPTFVAGAKVGSHGASFSGTSGEYVSTSYTPSSTGTISMWFKLTSNYGSATGDKRLITCNRNSIGVNWGAPTPAVGTNSGAIDFVISPSAGNYSDLETSQTAWLGGVWYHLVATWDGTNQKVYVNGLLDKSISQTKTGGWGTCNFPDSTRAFAGQMDDLAIWNGKALTLSQVQSIYSRQSAKYSGQITSRVMDGFLTTPSWTSFSAGTTLPFLKEMTGSAGSEATTDYSSTSGSLMTNLVGLWHLDETSGTSFADASSNAATGTSGGTIAYVKGRLGNGIKFDGSTGYISAPWNRLTGNAPRSMSVWFKTTSTVDTLFMSWGSNNSNQLSQLGIFSGRVGLTCYGNDLTVPISNTDYADGRWHHILVTFNGSTRKLFMDGDLVASDSTSLGTGTSDINIGRGIAAAYYFNGSLDEVAVWSRALTDAEALEVYRRGGNRIKYQVRSCTNSDCSDQDALTTSGLGWKGPDNTNQTYFSELHNNSSINSAADPVGTVKTSGLNLSFADFSSVSPAPVSIASTRYVQYRAVLESDEQNSLCSYGNCSPELKLAKLGPDHYDTTVQTIISKASIGESYLTIDTNGFTETGGTCSAGLKYALSGNGTNFYYWNGSAWAASSGYATASDATTIRSNINTFPSSAAGTGTLQIETFLKSDGTSSCEVDNLQVTGSHP